MRATLLDSGDVLHARHPIGLACNDAGARHVALAFSVPCVVLFGPTALQKTNLGLGRVTALRTGAGTAGTAPLSA